MLVKTSTLALNFLLKGRAQFSILRNTYLNSMIKNHILSISKGDVVLSIFKWKKYSLFHSSLYAFTLYREYITSNAKFSRI